VSQYDWKVKQTE